VKQLIGWSASAMLVVMIVAQIVRQWRQGTSKGVSRWLFVCQLLASSLFVVYSVMVGDVVFIVTNALMAAAAVGGLGLLIWHRHRGR
jgi:MtN3 and saliva related transmembrane protein